jgi:hypothetical protein
MKNTLRSKKTKGSMIHRGKAIGSFLKDFAPLEREIGRGVTCPVERMVIELHLTPERAKEVEEQYGIALPWFAATYSTLKRHSLLGTTSWENWLRQYRLRRSQAEQATFR